MRRLFINIDDMKKADYHHAQNKVEILLSNEGLSFVPEVFDEILRISWHDSQKAWEAVLRADEIYALTSFMPLIHQSYTGSPVVMDNMMRMAIEGKVTGKVVVILNKFSNIEWQNINTQLLRKAFRRNWLYTLERDKKNIYWRCPVDLKEVHRTIQLRK